MATRFERLAFTKDWRNAKDFATYEGDEAKVREDMQFLFNETRDFLNNFIGQVETMAVPGTGDMRAEVYDPDGVGKNVYAYVNETVNSAINQAIGIALEQEY